MMASSRVKKVIRMPDEIVEELISSGITRRGVACGRCNSSKCDLLLEEWQGRL